MIDGALHLDLALGGVAFGACGAVAARSLPAGSRVGVVGLAASVALATAVGTPRQVLLGAALSIGVGTLTPSGRARAVAGVLAALGTLLWLGRAPAAAGPGVLVVVWLVVGAVSAATARIERSRHRRVSVTAVLPGLIAAWLGLPDTEPTVAVGACLGAWATVEWLMRPDPGRPGDALSWLPVAGAVAWALLEAGRATAPATLAVAGAAALVAPASLLARSGPGRARSAAWGACHVGLAVACARLATILDRPVQGLGLAVATVVAGYLVALAIGRSARRRRAVGEPSL